MSGLRGLERPGDLRPPGGEAFGPGAIKLPREPDSAADKGQKEDGERRPPKVHPPHLRRWAGWRAGARQWRSTRPQGR